MTLELRRARWGELDAATLYRILWLRCDVFVVEQVCAYDDLDGRDIEPATVHIWAVDGDEVVGALRVLVDVDVMRIGRLVVARSHRSAGLGARLVAEALELIGKRTTVLDAQAHLQGWYESFGFEVCGPGFLDVGIPHVPMRREPR